MYCKAKATEEQKERAKKQDRTPDWGGRGDTWTDRSTPVYDKDGNQIGSFNDRSGWDDRAP